MFTKATMALALLTGCLAAHAATQSFAFEYSSPDWTHHYYGQFSADDVNGDGTFALAELKSFRFHNYDWMPCASTYDTCVVKEFSYQPGAPVTFEAYWDDNSYTTAFYHFPSEPNKWVYYSAFSFCDGPRCYYDEDFDNPSDNWTFSITNTTPVPEPESWLMLGAGLAVVGAARRRRSARRSIL